MATLEQIGEALKRADAAGNTADAKALAQAYKAMKDQSGATGSGSGPSQINVMDIFNKQYRQGPYAPPPAQPRPDNPQNSVLPGILGQLSNTFRAATQGAQDTMTIGFGDELAAGAKTGIDAATGQPVDYGKNLQQAEGITADTANLNPDAYNAGTMIGTAGLMGRPGIGVLAALPAKGLIRRAALQSGALGATMGLGTPGSIEQRLQNAAIGGVSGLALGAGGGAVAKILGRGVATAPTVRGILDEAKSGFRAAENSGAIVDKPAVQNIVGGLRQILVDEGALTPSGKIAGLPKVAHAIALADDYAGAPMTMEQMFRLRKQVAKAAGSIDPDERQIGVTLLKHFDNSVESLSSQAGDFVGGGASAGDQATQDWAKARQLWQTGKKGQTVEKLITSAKRQARKSAATPGEQTLRNKFETFYENDKNLRGFSPAERAAISKVATGTKVGNIAKAVGRLAPTTLGGLGFKGGVPFAIGSYIGGPAAGFGLAGTSLTAGTIGRIVSTLSTRQQAELARVLVLNGGKVPAKIATGVSPEVRRALGNIILMGGSKAPEIGQSVMQMLQPVNQ